MKTLKYITLSIILIIIILSCQVHTPGVNRFREIVLQSQCSLDKAQLTISKEIISKRLDAIYIRNFTVTSNDEKSQLIVKLNDSLKVQEFSNLLTEKGEAQFCLAFGNQEVISSLKKLDPNQLLIGNTNAVTLLSYLQSAPNGKENSPVIGVVNTRDTALLIRCLHSEAVKKQLQEDLQFVWGQCTDSTHRCPLYALATKTSINSMTIQQASVSTSQAFEIEINLLFNSEGSGQWKDLTGKNIGKSIAVVVDNNVYAAPMVRSAIDNGKCVITGNYTGQEANKIVSVLKSGELPCPFKIVN